MEQSVAQDPVQIASGIVDVSLHSTELLASLVRFMGPVIEATAPSSSSQAKQDVEEIRLDKSVEGQELVKSLENFIGFVVKTRGKCTLDHTVRENPESCPKQDSNNSKEQSIISDRQDIVHESATTYNMLDLNIYSDPLPLQIRNTVDYYIFKYLPIRLLTFDSDGSNIRLIERGALVGLVVKHLQEVRYGVTPWAGKKDAYMRD